MNWHAHINAVTEDYLETVRRTEDRFDEIEARAQAAMSRIGEQLAAEQMTQEETSEEQASREAREERDRLLRAAATRTRTTEPEPQHRPQYHRNDFVLPSDWTDIDEARLDGDGPPDSWLA